MPAKILIADDDENFVFLFISVLGKIDPDAQCKAVTNGYEALTYLKFMLPAVPDFIFVDINMPIMDGYEIVKAIKNISALSDVPLILFSGGTNPLKVKGVEKVFLKPVSMYQLRNMILQVLNTKELQ